MGVYEVTFDEWYACLDAGGCGNYLPDIPDDSWDRGNRPVINVSWEDAQSYVSWLSARTGKTYRLLSESEWEYVARAGTETAYSWGDSVGVNRANCDGCGSAWDGKRQHQWAHSRPMLGAFTICTEMCGNGFKIVGTGIMRTHQQTVLRGRLKTALSM